jgi:tetratricopeptide (TPR) repeat protein
MKRRYRNSESPKCKVDKNEILKKKINKHINVQYAKERSNKKNLIRIYNQGETLLESKSFYRALLKFDVVLEKLPNDKKSLLNKNICLFNLEKYDEAFDTLEKLIELDKRNVDYLIWKAYIYEAKREVYECLNILDKCLTINPKYDRGLNDKGRVLSDYLNQHQEAIECIKKAIEINPTKAKYYFNLGHVYGAFKQYDSAITSYSSAIKINPEMFIAYFQKAMSMIEIDKYHETVDFLTSAIKKFPDEGSLYYNRGDSYFELKMFKEAIPDYQQSINLKNQEEESYESIGKCYSELKKFEDALTCFKKCLEYDKYNLIYLFEIAETSYHLGDCSDAKDKCFQIKNSANPEENLITKVDSLLREIDTKLKNDEKIIGANDNQSFKMSNEIKMEILEKEKENVQRKSIFSNLNLNYKISDDNYFFSKTYLKKIPIKTSENIKQDISEFFKKAKQLKHDKIVFYNEYELLDNSLNIKMDYCNYESLQNYLNSERYGILSIKDKIKICLDCAAGLYYLHYNGILHGKIKYNNVLLQKFNTEYSAKLTDYGVWNILEKTGNTEEYYSLKNFRWRAPELIKDKSVEKKSDIYSFGILIWEIFSNKIAFSEYSYEDPLTLIIKIIGEKLRPDLNLLKNDTPELIKKIIEACWNDDDKERPDAEELCKALYSCFVEHY